MRGAGSVPDGQVTDGDIRGDVGAPPAEGEKAPESRPRGKFGELFRRSPAAKSSARWQDLGVKAVNETLGRYDLTFEIDAGGFATLYLARTIGPGGFQKFVAIKCIHQHLARNEEFVEMFLDEARIAVSVSHPNICPVFDFGEADGKHFLAMDYILGESLGDVIPLLSTEAGGCTVRERCAIAAWVVAAAAEGLHAAHESRNVAGEPLQIVHRDVSPSNIFLRYDGHVQLVDFGLASASNKVHQTRSGIAKGKVSYMSPEQFRGQSVDRRIDIWALGVVLYEIVSGKKLFQRETDAKTMHAVLNDPMPPLSQYGEDVPEALEIILSGMLQKDRDQRFGSAFEVSQALRAYLREAHVSVSSHEIGMWMRNLFANRFEQKRAMIAEAREREGSVRRSRESVGAEVENNSAKILEDVSVLINTHMKPKRSGRGFWTFASIIVIAVTAVLITWLWRTPGHAIPYPGEIASYLSSLFEGGDGKTSRKNSAVAVRATGKRKGGKKGKVGENSLRTDGDDFGGAVAASDAKRFKSPRFRGTTGLVHINTGERGADVFWKGERIGSANASIELPVGLRKLLIYPHSRAHQSTTIEVRVLADNPQRVPLSLQRRSAQ